jgi:hypothetical protein
MACAVAIAAAACGLDKGGLLAVAGDDGGEGASDGGADGTSSSSGGGPGDDATGDAGSGDTTTGDDGAAPGDAGIDVPPPPPDATPAPLQYDGGPVTGPDFSDLDWVKFCVGVTGCYSAAGTISACLANLPQPLGPDVLFPPPAVIQCVVAAGTNCQGVAGCFQASQPCNPSQNPDLCSGNQWITCRLGVSLSVDCTSLGLVCSSGSGNAGCGFGDCFAWQEGETLCAGDYVVRCHQGRYEPAVDCAALKATCQGSPAACAGIGPGCTGLHCDQLRGDGTFKCALDPSGTAVCSAGNACTSSFADTCDKAGHIANFCNGGAGATYDCHGAGWLNGCQNGRCSNL